MIKRRISEGLASLGFGLLSICGAAQWWHTLASGRTDGLSLAFVVPYILGMALMSVAFRLNQFGWVWEIGNGLGLFNALMMLGAWWWVG